MKRFAKNILLFLILVILTGALGATAAFFTILPQYSQTYNAALLDKVSRAQSIHEPKIMLIGNSSLAFGVDSQTLSEKMGMPVVNMGLHGGLGNQFHERMAWQYAQPGDIVVVSFSSYTLGTEDDAIDYPLMWTTIENHTDLYTLTQKSDVLPLVRTAPKYLFESFLLWVTGTGNRSVPGSCYDRAAFNQYGDDIFPRPHSEFTFRGQASIRVNDAGIQSLNDLNAHLESIGAKLVVVAPPIGKGQFTPSATSLKAVQERLSRSLDCEVVSDFLDYRIDYRYFYNSEWHLNDEGVQIYTKLLIRDLSAWSERESQFDRL